MGDPEACEHAAAECDLAARQLDAPINRLLTLRGNAVNGWTGCAGDSLVCAVDTRRQSLVQAQSGAVLAELQALAPGVASAIESV